MPKNTVVHPLKDAGLTRQITAGSVSPQFTSRDLCGTGSDRLLTVQQLLIAARHRIDSRWCWAQCARARTAANTVVEIDSRHAVRWSADGALELEACGDDETRTDALKALGRQMGKRIPLAFFNDNNSHETVIALFDRAIAACAVAQEDSCRC